MIGTFEPTIDATVRVVAAPRDTHRAIDHAVVTSEAATTLYLRLSDSANADGSEPQLVRTIPIGAGFSGTVVIDRQFSGSVVITASTSPDGTGAPAGLVTADLVWRRV